MLPGQTSYALGGLAQALNITYRGAAHRAESDAEVSTRLLLHIGDSLRHEYHCQSIEPSLLEAINRQSAAKVVLPKLRGEDTPRLRASQALRVSIAKGSS
jgi:DNA polymerase III subunit epsilon